MRKQHCKYHVTTEPLTLHFLYIHTKLTYVCTYQLCHLPGGGVTSARSSGLRPCCCCCCPSCCGGLLSRGRASGDLPCSSLSEDATFLVSSWLWFGELVGIAEATPLFPSLLGEPSSSSGSLSKAGLVWKTSPQRPQRNLPEHRKVWQRMQNVWALFLSKSTSKVDWEAPLLLTKSRSMRERQ